jgi:hypothetical protein
MWDGTIFILSHETQPFFGQEDNTWNNEPIKLCYTYKQCLQSLAQLVYKQFSHHVCVPSAINKHSLMSTYPNDQPVQNIISYSEFVAGIRAAYIFLLNKRHPWRNWRRQWTRSMKECCMEKFLGGFETQRMSRLQKFCQNDTFHFEMLLQTICCKISWTDTKYWAASPLSIWLTVMLTYLALPEGISTLL